MTEKQSPRISVSPRPTGRELAAIAAAVVATIPNVHEDESSVPVNKWREAGKREALREHMWERHR